MSQHVGHIVSYYREKVFAYTWAYETAVVFNDDLLWALYAAEKAAAGMVVEYAKLQIGRGDSKVS